MNAGKDGIQDGKPVRAANLMLGLTGRNAGQRKLFNEKGNATHAQLHRHATFHIPLAASINPSPCRILV